MRSESSPWSGRRGGCGTRIGWRLLLIAIMLCGGLGVMQARAGVPGALAANGLVVTNTVSDDPLIGSTVTYGISVRNDGTFPSSNNRAYNLDIIDTLPPGVAFASSTLGVTPTITTTNVVIHGTTVQQQTLTFTNITDVVPNQTYSATITGTLINAILPGDTLTNVASARASTDPRSPASGSSGLSSGNVANTSTAQPFKLTKKTIQSTGVNQATGDCATDRLFHYELQVTNNGVQASTNLTVTDTLPYGVVYCAANGGNTPTPAVSYAADGTTTITYTIPTLASTSTATFEVYTAIPYTYPTTQGGTAITDSKRGTAIPDGTTFTNTATLVGTYAGSQYTLAPKTAKVTAKYATIAKGGNVGVVGQNSVITYTLTVSTSVYYNATNVVVVDTLPNGQQYLDGSASLTPVTVAKPTGDPVPGGTSPTVTATRTDGQTIITWNVPSASTTADTGYTITFQAQVRTTYSNSTQPPVVSGDGFTNTADLVFDAANIAGQTPASSVTAATDSASASQQTVLPTFSKTILAVTKADGSTPPANEGRVVAGGKSAFAAVGDIVTFQLSFAAAGNIDSRNIVITDILPASYQYIAGTTTYGGTYTGTINGTAISPPPAPECAVTPCAAGALLNYRLTGTGGNNIVPKGNTLTITLAAKVVAQGSGVDTNLGKVAGDNTQGIAYSARDGVSITALQPSLALNKTNSTSGTSVLGNAPLTYTVTMMNTGTSTAYHIANVVDTLPADIKYVSLDTAGSSAGVTVVSYSPGTGGYGGTLTVAVPATLAPGATTTIKYNAQVSPAPVVGTSEVNRAAVASYYAQDNETLAAQQYGPASAQSTVRIGSDILTKTATIVSAANGGGVITIGDTLSYTLGYTLQNNVTVFNAQIRECLPLGFHYVAGSYSGVATNFPNSGAVATMAAQVTTQNGDDATICPPQQEALIIPIGSQSNTSGSSATLTITLQATVTGLTQPIAPATGGTAVFPNTQAVYSTRSGGGANVNRVDLYSAASEGGTLRSVANKTIPNNGTDNNVYVPRLTTTKTIVPPGGSVAHTPNDGTTVVPASSTVRYLLALQNVNAVGGRGATAFDLGPLLDTLDPGLTYVGVYQSDATCQTSTAVVGVTQNGQQVTIPHAERRPCGGRDLLCLPPGDGEHVTTPSTVLPNNVQQTTAPGNTAAYYTQPATPANAARAGYAPPAPALASVRTPDVITFPAPANATYGDDPITLGASSSGGRPIDYTSTTPTICSDHPGGE